MLIVILAAYFTSQVSQTSVSVWRDSMPGPEKPSKGIMASTDVAEFRGPADTIRLNYAGQAWESPLRFTYWVNETLPVGQRVARYHASGKDNPAWPVGSRVTAQVRVSGKWVDFGECEISETH
jgi:hypothetical protein